MKNQLLCLILFLNLHLSKGQPLPICFHAQNNLNTINVGQKPVSVTSSDFNGDGIPDIATANYNSNNISIVLNSGLGSFSAATNISIGFQPSAIISADFNSDGKMDLVTSNYGSNNISVLLSLGNGSFSSVTNYNSATNPQGLVAADFNNDGKLDIVVTNANSANFSLLNGNGLGGFNAATYFSAGTNPYGVIASDFNADGNMDVAITNAGSNNLTVRLGNGSGSFGAITNYSVGNSPQSLVAADFNGDTKLDLAVANYSSNFTPNTICILLGSGAGTFSVTNSFTSTPAIPFMLLSPASIVSNDYNTDGKQDLAITYSGSNCISIRLGTGVGTFNSSIEYVTDTNPFCLINQDINLDGHMDLITANIGSNNVTILLGSSFGSFCAASSYKTMGNYSGACGDFNEDGHQDFVVANSSYNSSFSVLFGDGTGKIATPYTPSSLQGGGAAYSILAGDLNNDSHLDIVVSIFNGAPYIYVFYGNGDGSFFSSSGFLFGSGSDPADLAAGDFNEDGFTDIASSNFSSDDVSILTGYNSPFPGYPYYSWPYISVMSGGSKPSALNASDFNGDGHLDLAITNYASNNVSVRLGNGTGAFGIVANFPVGLQPISIKAGDLNGDNIKDLVIANYNSNNISILLGAASGSFASAVNYSVNSNPRLLSLGDFNGDTFLDIVVPNFGSSNISVLAGNGSGAFGSSITYVVGEDPSSVSVADFNEDGRLDIVTSSQSGHSTLLLNGIPKITFTGASGVCLGNSITIQANGASSYTWNTGATTSSINVSPFSNSIYTVHALSLGSCEGSTTKSIAVSPNFTISASNGSICSGQSFTISPNGANTYTYSGGSSIVSPSIATNYSVTGTNSLDCVALNTVVITVTVIPLPTLTITGNSSICQGMSISQFVNGSALTYTWSNGTTGNVVSLMPSATTVYTVSGSNAYNCINSVNKVIIVNPLPNVVITTSSSLVCTGETLLINASGANFYLWNNGLTSAQLILNPVTTSNYSVIGTDLNGCINTAAITQIVDACTGINAFERNGLIVSICPNPTGGKFNIEFDRTTSSQIVIFNISGARVFSSNVDSKISLINLEEYPSGIYFLEIRENGKVMRNKIIKE